MRGEEIRVGIDIYPVLSEADKAKLAAEGKSESSVPSLGKSKKAATLAVSETARAMGIDLYQDETTVKIHTAGELRTHALEASSTDFALDDLRLPLGLFQQLCAVLDISFRNRLANKVLQVFVILDIRGHEF